VRKSCFNIDNFCKSGCFSKEKHPVNLWAAIFSVTVLMGVSVTGAVAQDASSQKTSGFAIHGVVVDVAGKPVDGASVKLEQKASLSVVTTTDSTGAFTFPALHAGAYVIRAEKAGLRSRTTDVTAGSEGSSSNISLVLEKKGTIGSHPSSSGAEAMQFADQPNFTVAGITDWTAAGGHGSDITLRTSESLTRESATLKPDGSGSNTSDPSAAGNAERHRLLGDRDEESGDPLAAEHEYEQAAQLNPSEQNYFAWGSELLLHRAVQPAIEVFTKGADAYPKSARMLAALGAALFAGGHNAEAALRICRASDLNPADPTPYIFLGKIEIASPMPLDCVEPKLALFAQQQPGNALANYYYAMAIWKRQRSSDNQQALQQVKALLEKATAIDPNFADAYLQLGIFSFAQHNFANSVELYTKALEADPQLCDAHYRLGLAYQRIGEPMKAKSEFQLHDELEKQQAADVERQRREVKQFLVVLKGQPAPSSQQ
jgi:tetratricopeptide (TPR) repeat protein